MAESVVFAYDGAHHVRATISDAVEGATYTFVCDVSDGDEVTADGTGTAVLEVTDAAVGAAAEETFLIGVQRTDDAPLLGSAMLATAVVEVGTPGGPFPFTATWNWNGDKTVTVTFPGENGVGYFLRATSYKTAPPGFEQGSDSDTGAGAPLTLTVAFADTAEIVEAELTLATSPDHSDNAKSSRLFLAAGSGDAGTVESLGLAWVNRGAATVLIAKTAAGLSPAAPVEAKRWAPGARRGTFQAFDGDADAKQTQAVTVELSQDGGSEATEIYGIELEAVPIDPNVTGTND